MVDHRFLIYQIVFLKKMKLLNNFIYKSHKVCKKIADNDWVDKDGNRYNDAGIKQ